jgi:hypothetical protein
MQIDMPGRLVVAWCVAVARTGLVDAPLARQVHSTVLCDTVLNLQCGLLPCIRPSLANWIVKERKHDDDSPISTSRHFVLFITWHAPPTSTVLHYLCTLTSAVEMGPGHQDNVVDDKYTCLTTLFASSPLPPPYPPLPSSRNFFPLFSFVFVSRRHSAAKPLSSPLPSVSQLPWSTNLPQYPFGTYAVRSAWRILCTNFFLWAPYREAGWE